MSAVTLAFSGGGIPSGYVELEAIPDEKMSTLSSRILVAILVVGAMTVVLILALQYR
jgi:hypothetical protein